MIKKKSGSQSKVLEFMNSSDTHIAIRETGDAFDALCKLGGLTMLEPHFY